jgi:hypothetical protein
MAYSVKLPPKLAPEESIAGSPYLSGVVIPVMTGDKTAIDFPFSLAEEVTETQPVQIGSPGKRLGAFTSCLWCGSGTWARHGGLPTCPSCSRSWPMDRTPEAAKAHLWRLLDLWAGMDESQTTTAVTSGQPVPVWTEANVKALYEDIMDVFSATPEANGWLQEWRGRR